MEPMEPPSGGGGLPAIFTDANILDCIMAALPWRGVFALRCAHPELRALFDGGLLTRFVLRIPSETTSRPDEVRRRLHERLPLLRKLAGLRTVEARL